MPDPVPLHAHTESTDPVQVPEVLLISALLETGRFTPETYRVTDDELVAYDRVYRFCVNHQQIAGVAPDIDLVQRTFTDFPFIPNVNAAWAAERVHDAAYGRSVRRAFQTGLGKLNAGDYDGVIDAVTPLTKKPSAVRLDGLASTDPANVTAAAELAPPLLPTPYPSLQDLTDGGIRAAELWLMAARFKQGKTWKATKWAAHGAEHGGLIRYLSTEWPAWRINRRVNLHHAREDPGLANMVRSADPAEQTEALEELKDRITGQVRTTDLRATRMSVTAVEELIEDAHLVVIDHVGHLVDRKGRRAIEDWRIMAEISNELLEITNRTNVPILGVVQVNREGETKGWATPSAKGLSDTDVLGRDCTVLITMNRPTPGGSVMVEDLRANRDGPTGRYYTHFDPSGMRFEEITREQAEAQDLRDQDRAGRA